MFEEKIAAGASWLDEFKPGWERLIEPATLSLESPCRCVLGQVFHDEAVQATQEENDDMVDAVNGFDWTLETLNVEFTPWARDHGFSVAAKDFQYDEETYHAAFDRLETEWIDFVKDRFDRGALSA